MGLLPAFAPFIAFVIVERLVGVATGLLSATAVSALLLLRDLISHRTVKILELGTLIYLVRLPCTRSLQSPHGPSSPYVCGLTPAFLVVLVSLALRRPFTLQYASEQVPMGMWSMPEFIRTNYTITAVWAGAFALMVIAEAAILYVPGLPQRFGIIVTILAIYVAFRFTTEYPKRRRK